MKELVSKGKAAQIAARKLAKVSSEAKNQALLNLAGGLISRQEDILISNQHDYILAQKNGLSDALLDRMLLTVDSLNSIANDVKTVLSLPDPVGEIMDMRTMPNGLQVGRKRVPLGVIGVIYESRQQVTVDISTLCIKSGNAVILRGGKEAIASNTALTKLVRESLASSGLPEDIVQIIESTDRAVVGKILKMKDVIDLIIPRGGQDLVRRVSEEATMPAITGGIGVCHTYVDKAANIDKAVDIVDNAKVQRPTVCNALDTLLVHSAIAQQYLPLIAKQWTRSGVDMRCDRRAMNILGPSATSQLSPASDQDWGTEFLSLTAAVKVVDSLEEALDHIETYGSGHSEAIVTEDQSIGMRFLDEVDSSVVFLNASTRFNDGSQFGLGMEVAISTNKMHARGPMGLKELTSYKWVVLGDGQIRT